MEDLEKLELRITKLQLALGDVLVVKCARVVPLERATHLRDGIKDHLPSGVKCLVIDPEIDLMVLTRAEIEQRAA